MIYTSIILVGGFVMFTFTDFAVNANMGSTAATMLLMGAVFDLTVLPALIKFGQGKHADSREMK